MEVLFKLSRLTIIGEVSEKIPVCVLTEVADAHGIYFSEEDRLKSKFVSSLVVSILNTPTVEISINNIEPTHMQYIASFVNRDTSWNKTKLLEAFNYLMKFTSNEDPIQYILENNVFGSQTMQQPLSVNSCVLYKICCYHNIFTDSSTTFEQMTIAVKLLKTNITSITNTLNFFIKNNANKADLINMLLSTNKEFVDPNLPIICNETDLNLIQTPKQKIDHTLLSKIYCSLDDKTSLRMRIDPTTEPGSISLAAINFSLDISKSNYPVMEYINLRSCQRDNFVPVDPWLKYWYKENPNIFDLTVTFNPLFCDKFYKQHMLSIVTNEGYTSTEITLENFYELLQLAYVSKTFYQGNVYGVKSGITPLVNDTVDDIPYGELLCYGQMDSSEMEVISISELIDLFNENKNFSSPFTGSSVFSATSVNKLKLIANSRYGCNNSKEVSQSTLELRSRLLEVIISVELLTSRIDLSTRKLITAYSASSLIKRKDVIDCLTNLLHLGMFMRGWSGEGDYPIVQSNGLITTEEEKAVKVTEALNKYESSVTSLVSFGIYVNRLPLVIYKDLEYQPSISRKEGLTIGDRINLIKQGDKLNNIESCIRLSSNWISSSAHKYMIAIGLEPPFHIWKLNHIS